MRCLQKEVQTLSFFKSNNGNSDRVENIIPEDFVCVENAAKGDVASFEILVRKYEKFVCTTAYSVVRNYDDALDIAQEVFLKLYHNISSFKGESSFSSWLYRIAKNSALDFLRKQKNIRQNVSLVTESSDGDEVQLEIADTSEKTSPEASILKKEQNELLYSALDKLSDEHKEIIVLRDIEGYAYEEITDILQIEQGTVKSRLFRARENLRKILAEINYF